MSPPLRFVNQENNAAGEDDPKSLFGPLPTQPDIIVDPDGTAWEQIPIGYTPCWVEGPKGGNCRIIKGHTGDHAFY